MSNTINGQAKAVLEYLEKHDGITQRKASRVLGVDRLSAVVWVLKNKYGYNIVTVMRQVETRYGKTQIAEYQLVRGVAA